VLLTLAGLYLHYKVHPEREVSKDLVARIEKRWKDCDQPLFLVALILNRSKAFHALGPLQSLIISRRLAWSLRYAKVNAPLEILADFNPSSYIVGFQVDRKTRTVRL
jgi:hypothetical protein